jgi:hypothetical protein
MRQIEVDRQESRRRHQLAAAPVIEELRHVGFAIETLDELRRSGAKYSDAIPILLKWLPLIDDLGVKESIVRTLSVPWAKSVASRILITEFRKASDSGLKWAIGNALEVVADRNDLTDIVEIVRDKRHGTARQMMTVALGKMGKSRLAVDTLLELLGDEDVVGHAVIALGKLKAREARTRFEALLKHPKRWISNEARKALARLDKSDT